MQDCKKDAIDLAKSSGTRNQMNKRANKISGGQAQRAAQQEVD